jgi:hypothetical protein
VVGDFTTAVRNTGQVQHLRSPLGQGGERMISTDRRSALVTFEIVGDGETARERVGPVLDAVAAVRRAHPEPYVASGQTKYQISRVMSLFAAPPGQALWADLSMRRVDVERKWLSASPFRPTSTRRRS